jgi:hypothetical protein
MTSSSKKLYGQHISGTPVLDSPLLARISTLPIGKKHPFTTKLETTVFFRKNDPLRFKVSNLKKLKVSLTLANLKAAYNY